MIPAPLCNHFPSYHLVLTSLFHLPVFPFFKLSKKKVEIAFTNNPKADEIRGRLQWTAFCPQGRA